MEQTFIQIGVIVNTHGVRGELKLLPRSLEAEALTACKTFYIDGRAVAPLGGRVHKGCLLFRLEDAPDLNAALPYKGKTVSVRRGDLALPEGTYFPEELMGMTVLDSETGAALGEIADVTAYPAHDVYRIKGEREFLVPAVPAFIAEVDLAADIMKIHVWEGLI